MKQINRFTLLVCDPKQEKLNFGEFQEMHKADWFCFYPDPSTK